MPKSGTALLHRDTPILLALTPAEAAAALRMSKSALYGVIRTGALASYTQGKSRRISVRALEAYQAALEAGDAPAA